MHQIQDSQPPDAKRIVVMLTEREAEDWGRIADRLGMTLPEFLRTSAQTTIAARTVWCPRTPGGLRCE